MPGPAPLFDNTDLRELNFTLAGESFSLLIVADVCALAHGSVKFPEDDIYWGELWPAALALAEAVLLGEVDLSTTPRSNLEIGCGTGLVSLSAARRLRKLGIHAGSPVIVAADREERALKLVAANAERNGVKGYIATQRMDWSDAPPERFERVLAADCLYQPDSGWKLASFIRDAVHESPQAFGIVADPQRWSARHFSTHADKAGLSVLKKSRPVPIARGHGPVERIDVPTEPAALQADLFELRRR